MSEANKDFPFQTLGNQLKRLREKRQESLADVSGAVEIDPDSLEAFEQGMERPSEDILLLLISHFATKEDTATKLWNLAGYDQNDIPTKNASNHISGEPQEAILSAEAETPIVYTDMVHVMVNNYGVVMNFMQTSGSGNQPMAVARVGMSKEHAQSVLEVLQKTMQLHEPKAQSKSDTKKPNTDQ